MSLSDAWYTLQNFKADAIDHLKGVSILQNLIISFTRTRKRYCIRVIEYTYENISILTVMMINI